MNRLHAIVFGLTIGLIFYSCSNERVIPNSSGKSSEMLVVANPSIWNGITGEAIRSYFGRNMDGLPQPEPKYSLTNIAESAFSTIFRSHRNLLIISINPDFTTPFVETRKDFWAQPQRVVKINASSDTASYRIFKENKEAFLKLFDQVERERIQMAFASAPDVALQNLIAKEIGLSMSLPQGYFVAKNIPGFIWLRRETLEISQGFLIYVEKYVDTAMFNPNYILSRRDIITQRYIPGTFAGTFMTTARSFIPPVSRQTQLNGRFAVETRGLWEVEGDFMGGPFINYTFVDETTNRIVTLDGYVYAPRDRKRDLIRQLEAIIHTTKPFSE
ncbi:MAG TPA: DUF4837 family protein [Bacteroidales bacterium]|nr:DUF4837 family protein [Bacteroidales bacterium]